VTQLEKHAFHVTVTGRWNYFLCEKVAKKLRKSSNNFRYKRYYKCTGSWLRII